LSTPIRDEREPVNQRPEILQQFGRQTDSLGGVVSKSAIGDGDAEAHGILPNFGQIISSEITAFSVD
jgi:hypothetical protein